MDDKIIKLRLLPTSLRSELVGHEYGNAASSSTVNAVRQGDFKGRHISNFLDQDHSMRGEDQKSATCTYFLVNMLGPAGAGASGREGDQGYWVWVRKPHFQADLPLHSEQTNQLSFP